MVCGYGKASRDAAVMVMFKAYFDDSCSDGDNKILVLAGCVQSYKVWADFSISWEAALVRTPSIRHFHMRDARHLEGEFKRWKAKDRDEKIHFLATVVETFRPWTIVAWVSRKEHDTIVKPIAPSMINHAYFDLFYAVILKLAHWHEDMGIKLPVEYVFDEQGKLGDDAAIWHRHIKSWQAAEVAALMGGTPKFENDEWVLPLQAADMLAWHVRRRKEKPHEELSALATAPLENLTYAEIHITRDWLVKVAEQMKQVPNVELVQSNAKKINKNEIRDVIRAMPTKQEYERQKSKPKG
jgi:hypothetical protein